MSAVLLFARAPIPGRVKTRLAAAVGPGRALRAYRWSGWRVADALGGRFPLTVWFDPPDARAAMEEWLGTAHAYRPQAEGDLGRRMRAAFAEHFAAGEGPVVTVGADAPGIRPADVEKALRALRRVDVAVGPAPDGGYWLLGLRSHVPELFEGIPWGGPQVLAATLRRCDALGLRVRRLRVLRDLDTADDLRALGLQWWMPA